MATGQHPLQTPILPRHDPPRSLRNALPTMYDLPSEDPEEPGLPDEFHYYQPQLLRETFRPTRYAPERVFVATDLNLYYTLQHPLWHKRPDWFAVLGVSALHEDNGLRLSYVLWQEDVVPYLIVELLSPGTEDEDLGKTVQEAEQPPTKWMVYEQMIGVPYYVVFSRYTDAVYYYERTARQYRQLTPTDQRLWLPEAGIGIGVWFGTYHGRERRWLRFYDDQGVWIPTPLEQEHQRAEQEHQRAEQEHQRAEQERQRAEQERQRAEQERQRAEQAQHRAVDEQQRAERLAAQLRALGMEPTP